MPHRFTLEKNSSAACKTTCPMCRNRTKTFKRYIDTETLEYLADHVGICDRQDKCGYHYTPHEYFQANPDKRPGANIFPPIQPDADEENEYQVLPWHFLEETMRAYQQNYFVDILNALFGEEKALKLANKYYIGTAKHWHGSNIFWQVDIDNLVRAGKIMLYDPETCRRVKDPVSRITWVHSLLRSSSSGSSVKQKKENTATATATATFQIKQCFFGEHLLRDEPEGGRIVAIVESEKTAILASEYHPEYIWLAAGSLDGITYEKCKALTGRQVILYPDVNGYRKWYDKARELNARMLTTTFTVSDYLVRTATQEEKERGIDIADRWIDELLMQWEIEKEWGLR